MINSIVHSKVLNWIDIEWWIIAQKIFGVEKKMPQFAITPNKSHTTKVSILK